MSRGKAALSWVLRVALLVGVIGLLVLVSSQPAMAMPPGRHFTSSGPLPVWPETATDGTVENDPITVEWATVARGDQLYTEAPLRLNPNQSYFYVALHPTHEYDGYVEPMRPNLTAATLTTAGGSVTEQAGPRITADVDDSWYFPVSADVGSATLQVDGFSQDIGDEFGDFMVWTFGPITVDFVATGPLPTSPPTSIPTVTTQPHPVMPSPEAVAAQPGGDTPLAAKVGVGVAALTVISAGGAGAVSLLRRRAFYRADRGGRILLSGPPVLIAGATLPTGVVVSPDRPAIVVKLLGALEVEGTKRQVIAGPVLEIIVFLALNPGRTFNSAQLRESIWGLGRQPITSNTFRVYMVQLRKAFGSGVVVTNRQRYEMTGSVTSDWDMFQVALQADDQLSGREQGLALVRGPVLHGSFDGRKNSPFSWAVGMANNIEDEVASVAVELALSCLEGNDPQRASTAVSQGLLCSEANLRLRTIDLGVGAAIGGTKEVGRRLEAGRATMATFPKDVIELEEIARQLGWGVEAPT